MTCDDAERSNAPGLDPRLGPAPQGCTLAESMAGLVDEARQIRVDLGLRPYRVFSVVVRWSGGERHRGTPTVVSTNEFLPSPRVEGISNVSRDLRSAGAVERGSVMLSELSGRYTEDDIDALFPRALGRGEEHYIEIVGTTGDRRRYVVDSVPERRPERFDWMVRVVRQDENRTRRGAPR